MSAAAPALADRELLGRLHELRALSRAQLQAAKKLDAVRLAELNVRRDELVFDVQLLVDEGLPLPAEQQDEIRALCEEILALEERLAKVSRTVLAIVGASVDSDTYDRQGRVGLAG